MAEYIEREAVIDSVKNLMSSFPAKDNYAKGYDAAIGRALIAVRAVSAVDVQPVKRGHWIDCTFYDPYEKSYEQSFVFKCSNCGHKIYKKPNDDNRFCGHCGADMRGDTE